MAKKLTKEKFYTGFKIIAKYLKPYKKELIVLSVLGVLSAIANGIVPYLAGRLIDAIIAPSTILIGNITLNLAIFFLIIWGLVQVVASLSDWFNNSKSKKIGVYIEMDYITAFFQHLLKLPITFHKTHKAGEVFQKTNRASGALHNITTNVIITLVPQFLSIFVALTLSFFINPTLAFVLLAGITLFVLILLNIIRPAAMLQRKILKFYNKAYGLRHDAISNIREIKQSTTEAYEEERARRNFREKAAHASIGMAKIWHGLHFYQRVVVLATQVSVFALSILFISQGKMTVGELVMFNGYAAMLFGPFVQLGRNWQVVQNGLIALEEAEEILKLPTEIYKPKDAVRLKEIKGDVAFQSVSFSYEKQKPVLENISFDIKAGEVVALVGRSGVGKSTLIDLISGYYFPKKGRVFIDGHDIKRIDLEFLRSNIAVVPQESILFNDTVEKNLTYGSFKATREEIENAAQRAYVSEFVEKFPKKWKQLVGERGIKLSAGQKQRVAIARAILRDPKILILDEPTSALDAHSEQHIQESLKELMEGRTTFIIAHRLSTVRRADKIIVMKEGKIIETGKHDELIKKENGEYRHLYELQIGLHE